jgi:hypothetical protein
MITNESLEDFINAYAVKASWEKVLEHLRQFGDDFHSLQNHDEIHEFVKLLLLVFAARDGVRRASTQIVVFDEQEIIR